MAKNTVNDTTTSKDKNINDKETKVTSTTATSGNIMDQPPKLKREYQSKRKENKGWSEEDMLNDLDATMEDDTNDATKNNNDEEEDEMSIDNTDNMSITIEDNQEGEDDNDAINNMLQEKLSSYSLDCYPYTFSPLLLFTSPKYFDRGYSNYNAVAAFFAPALADLGVNKKEDDVDGNMDGGDAKVASATAASAAASPESNRSNMDNTNSPTRSPPRKSPRNGGGSSDNPSPHDSLPYEEQQGGINMLHGVIYERKNLTYDEVFHHIVATQSLVTCCIDAHFTAFQILNSQCLIYYDPLSPSIRVAFGESAVMDAALFLLMKCKYGDDVHVQENKNYYTGSSASGLQRRIYQLWKKINQMTMATLDNQIRWSNLPLGLDRYLFINSKQSHGNMSTQLTGNTCYFQVYLFAVLCKVGKPFISKNRNVIELLDVDLLEEATVRISLFLLTFFLEPESRICRPLTNSNFILDFHRYEQSQYYRAFVRYLEGKGIQVPKYDAQYEGVMGYFAMVKALHGYDKFTLEGATASTPNSKSLQYIQSTDGAAWKLCHGDYYKYRAANLMFGCNTGAMLGMSSFSEFNAWRKNQLLPFHASLQDKVEDLAKEVTSRRLTMYRDYYFMPQFEVGQQELIDIHHYTYLIDMCSLGKAPEALGQLVLDMNEELAQKIYYSTQNRNNYHKIMKSNQFENSKAYRHFLQHFMGVEWFGEYIGLGLSDINPKEKDINCLTQTVFYSQDLMRSQQFRQEYEFEKECVNEMARANSRRFNSMFNGRHIATRQYRAEVSIGKGYTYSKYNTLMHFLNVAEAYWSNPDVNNIQVFGKDIRTLLAITCQKIFFNPRHCGYYYYGPLELRGNYRVELDLALGSATGHAGPQVSMTNGGRSDLNYLTIVDRVYEFSYLKGILQSLFESAKGARFKSDNGVLNLMMLSLQLDFGLFDEYAKLLNIPFMKDLQHEADTKELQVEIANLIYDFDRKHNEDAVTRSKVEHLIFQASYNFIVNKNFDLHSNQFKLIQMLNGDPDYQEYVLLCKIYMSLCQINKSVEVDYYKIKCNGLFHIVIPQNFSKKTSDYLEHITIHHSFSESEGIMKYDDISVFDLRPHQPEINLYTIKLQSKTDVQSMVKYIEFTNVFQTLSSEEQYLVFIGDNVILVDVVDGKEMNIRINQVDANVSTIFFNEAISFIPCFKYTEGEDVIVFTSRNIHYLVDKGGQFCPDYYGMKHEVVDCMFSDELFSDLNDDPRFRQSKLSDLVTESKVVVYFPDYLLLVSSRQQLINLLDYAVYIRNVSFFILVLFMLERTSMKLRYEERKDKVVQITGPWKDAILYMLGNSQNSRYDSIFKKQFFDINQYKNLPLREFIDKLCENFPRYQRFVDGEYQIVPREKQKRFLERIICGEECFHFSEVGSGKTKVIMPLLCQIFLSSNVEAHQHLARGGKMKDVLVILVPEHLVPDACSQVYRHCLNLNFRQKYKVYDDILALLHDNVKLGPDCKTIFVTSFNQFKKALTYDPICRKVRPHREQILVVCDEVDDFLDRDKLVFNICCNKSNSFDQPTMDYYHETSYAAYHGNSYPSDACDSSPNPSYWRELHAKFVAIFHEIQDASKSLNKSFGIFNEKTLRHCTSSISHDIEGYKALIARPYESVNRAMPGSYYSDVERTIFLTFVILSEDIAKYNELFQSERKFITFEYWKEYLAELDYDELVYGHDNLAEITEKHPHTLGGLIKFLYVIILKRMEVRDKSKSVNSVDIIFNFDCIGFTGTPFLDNYPTSDYIRHQREDDIPPCIDRSFYAYTNENLPQGEFEKRFYRFQGQNNNVKVKYLSSDFMNDSLKIGEMETLEAIFNQESSSHDVMPVDGVKAAPFNVIVDLCGIFKLSTIYDVRSLILQQFGANCFHYIYHIDQIDGSDRVLCIKTQNDVAFDEEFYKYLCRTYGADLRDKIFFFVDNRNYIGKDVPYQLVFQKHFNLPLFVKSVVVAHDVEDFSKIWQAMGRSRTMNDTTFSIYKSSISGEMNGEHGSEPIDIKKHPLTKLLYTRNCDCKMAGNLSSIYQTLIALYNLSKNSFYYSDEIVNTFIEKMEQTIMKKVSRLEEKLAGVLTEHIVPARILQHIFGDKFGRSSNKAISENGLSVNMVNELVRQIVRQKFEQRLPSGDIYDDYIRFLSGEQVSLMEISYTKQQQKQKQKQKAKSQDNDTMDMFDKRHQLPLCKKVEDYFASTIRIEDDVVKRMLGLPVSIPIFTLHYSGGGRQNVINVYPTVQFMYSHHINPRYITEDVRGVLGGANVPSRYYEDFLATVAAESKMEELDSKSESEMFHTETKLNGIRQNPQYSLVGIQPGVYIIGMKDQFNIHDIETHPLKDHMQCAMDEIGFVLFDKTNTKSVDEFGPYFIEQYILLDALSKQEVAQNVITYYCRHKEKLEKGLESYNEKRGKGFICWRFLSFAS